MHTTIAAQLNSDLKSSGASARQTALRNPAEVPQKISKKIVVVEDDSDMRELFKSLLEDEGYDVVVTKSGEELLALIDGRSLPPVVVLDLTLPMLSGTDILGILNQRSDRTQTKVIVASAWENGAALARENGANAFVKKPLDLDLLLSSIAEFFQQEPKKQY